MSLQQQVVHPLISDEGAVAPEVQIGSVGVYAIFDSSRRARHIGLSRDVATSLRRALARRPDDSYYYAAHIVTRPNRQLLESVRDGWIQHEDGHIDGCDGGKEQQRWESPVDVMSDNAPISDEDRSLLRECEDGQREKILKKVCRNVQNSIENKLKARGLTEKLKFAPKLKSRGLLDVESVKVVVPDTI